MANKDRNIDQIVKTKVKNLMSKKNANLIWKEQKIESELILKYRKKLELLKKLKEESKKMKKAKGLANCKR